MKRENMIKVREEDLITTTTVTMASITFSLVWVWPLKASGYDKPAPEPLCSLPVLYELIAPSDSNIPPLA